MATFMDKLQEIMRNHPDNIALMSEGKSHGLTYEVLDRNSGKIYSWLKSHGIGREDFVLVCLPRGVRSIVAMLGVLKAGAAFVLVESTYSPDRIAFIKQDCGCCMTIDEEVFIEMMEADYLEGFEKADLHDAAYAVYTSGTTGNPKGVLHEYGNLEQCYESLNYGEGPMGDENTRFALVAPLNFVASVIVLFNVLLVGGTTYIVPYSIVKNLMKLQEFLVTEKITHTFMTASLVRVYQNPAPSLQNVYVSSEPANGISLEGVNLYNLHAMSETGFATTMFKIDRPYKEAPIGRPQFDLGIYILDDESNPVEDGEMGEFCFDSPYVRGYMNLPEKTKEAFRDGVFHSGDMAKRNPDGNIVLLGRNDDMIKINGNRIEPAEIEAAVKSVLGLSHVVAKGFDNGKRAYVCAYYLNSEPKAEYAREMSDKIEELNELLLKRIPYYMLPTYYVGLDEFPLNANGKLSRKSLKEPEAALFRAEYRAPSNETEEKLCAAFERVLKVEKIGVDDDFYLLGGDSISAMELLTKGGVAGFEMGDLFKYHTPAKIAEALENREIVDEDFDEGEAKARETGCKLDNEQIYVVDFQFEEPKLTMWNVSQLFKMKEDVDVDRLAAAVEKAMRNHGAFSAKIGFNEDCDMIFEYDPEIFTPPEIIDISEEKLMEGAQDLRKPFTRIIGHPLYRVKIFRTEKNAYLFTDIWHAIVDGTSLAIFRDEIVECYLNPDAELKKDYFFLANKKQLQLENTEQWEEARKYYESQDVSGYHWFPDFDDDKFELKMGLISGELKLDDSRIEASSLVSEIGRNAFYTLSLALATAAVDNYKKQAVQSVVSARDSIIKANTFALLYRPIHLFFDFEKYGTIGAIKEETRKYIQTGTAYSFFPVLDEVDGIEDSSSMIYQRGIYELGRFGEIAEDMIDVDVPDATDAVLEIELIETETEQFCDIYYSANMYKPETMQKICNAFCKTAALLLEYGDRPETKIDEIIAKINE